MRLQTSEAKTVPQSWPLHPGTTSHSELTSRTVALSPVRTTKSFMPQLLRPFSSQCRRKRSGEIHPPLVMHASPVFRNVPFRQLPWP